MSVHFLNTNHLRLRVRVKTSPILQFIMWYHISVFLINAGHSKRKEGNEKGIVEKVRSRGDIVRGLSSIL